MIDKDSIELILAIWGAFLSTILAVGKIIQDQKEAVPKLFVDSQEGNKGHVQTLNLLIANTWKRPVTIIEISLGLGSDQGYQKLIYNYAFNPMLKLEESEPFRIEIEKPQIIKEAENLTNEDFMFGRLWLNIKLTSGSVIKKAIYIDPKLYNISVHEKYDEFIATAAFFERDIMEKYNQLWTRKMKYERR